MPVLYITILLVVVSAMVLFWFLQLQGARAQEFPPLLQGERQYGDMFLRNAILRVEAFSAKGRFVLFVAIALLILEFLVVLFFFAQNYPSGGIHAISQWYLLGGIMYFLLLLFAIFTGVRLTSVSREMPTFGDAFGWSKLYWEQKINELDIDQKNKLSYFLIEKLQMLEQSFYLGLVLLSSAITLFLVWIAHWLILVTH